MLQTEFRFEFVWRNRDNLLFYEQITPQHLKEYAALGGLEQTPDLERIKSWLLNCKKILDVGSCYGRTIKWLLQHGFKGDVYGVEYGKSLYQELIRGFTTAPNVRIKWEDILIFNTAERFDAILLMWSVITDFSQTQQPQLIHKLSQLLTPSGKIVIDTLGSKVTGSNTMQQGQSYFAEENKVLLHGYVPNENQIKQYSDENRLRMKVIEYFTSTERLRKLYLLYR